MKLLELIFGNSVYIPFSWGIKLILQLKGIKVGKNFRIKGVPSFQLNGIRNSIEIGDNVFITGPVDIRIRERGKITIGNNCKIDQGVRMIAANDAILRIGEQTAIGYYSVFNCGETVDIGKKCLISGFVYIQSSNHGIQKDQYIRDQKHTYGKIEIQDDVWLGSHVSVLAGVTLNRGSVIGSKAVVTKSIDAYVIAGGVPAKPIKYRE